MGPEAAKVSAAPKQARAPTSVAASGRAPPAARLIGIVAEVDETGGRTPYSRTLYRGGEGMWSWILHRVSGLAILGFLFLHILDTSLVALGPEHYNNFVRIYKTTFFRPLEVVLIAAVIYHSLNGIRVILIDFWERGARYERPLAVAQTVLSLVLFLPAAVIMLRPIF